MKKLCAQLLVLYLGVSCWADPAVAQSEQIELRVDTPAPHYIDSVAFSADGSLIISGTRYEQVELLDVRSGRLIRSLSGHVGSVRAVTFLGGSDQILSGGQDKTLRVWETRTGRLVRAFGDGWDPVVSVAAAGAGRLVLSGGERTARLWDASTGGLLRTLEWNILPGLISVALSPDAKTALVASMSPSTHGYRFDPSRNKSIRVRDAASGKLIRTLDGHTEGVAAVSFSPDGRTAASASFDKTVKLWDVGTGALLRTFEGHTNKVLSVKFSANGTRIVSGGWDDTIRVWDVSTGGLVRVFSKRNMDGVSVNSVDISPDGAHVLAAHDFDPVTLWNMSTGKVDRYFLTEAGSYGGLAFVTDDGHALTQSGAKWDFKSGRLIRGSVGDATAVSTDGAKVLTRHSSDRTVKILDATTGALIHSLEGHSYPLGPATFSPDGAIVAVASGDSGLRNTVTFWDAASGKVIRTLDAHASFIATIVFSPDGTQLVTSSSDGYLRQWDARQGKLLRNLGGKAARVRAVAFSPDGSKILSGGDDGVVSLWRAQDGKLLRKFEGHVKSVAALAFSRDGLRILTAAADNTANLWDADSGRRLHQIRIAAGGFDGVAFFDRDMRIALVSGSAINVWSTADGTLEASLYEGANGKGVTVTPSGFFVADSQAMDLLSVVRGLQLVGIDQLWQSLFNPDLVREALAGDLKGEVRDAAKVINLKAALDSGPAPDVAITSHLDGTEATSDLVTVQARITDRGKGIGRIEWRVNGVTAAVASKPDGGGLAYTLDRELALDPGDNTIEVVAYNGSNLLASLPARATVKFTGPADKTKPKLHILAIGINAYVDKGWAPPGKEPLAFGPLRLAVKDAETFAEAMKKAAADLYDDVPLTLAVNKDATRDNLHKLINKLAAQIHPRDSFILFAAAHGDAENGRFYLIPQDYQSGPPGTLARRAITQDDLQDWLANRIKARKAIVLLDTCESGSLIAGHKRSRTDAPASEAAVGRLHEATGRPVLTAAAAGQFAHEGLIAGSGERHGVFTWALLDALRNGDTNGDSQIQLSELVAHVQRVVPALAAKLGGLGRAAAAVPEPVFGQQTARFGSRGEDYALANRLQ